MTPDPQYPGYTEVKDAPASSGEFVWDMINGFAMEVHSSATRVMLDMSTKEFA